MIHGLSKDPILTSETILSVSGLTEEVREAAEEVGDFFLKDHVLSPLYPKALDVVRVEYFVKLLIFQRKMLHIFYEHLLGILSALCHRVEISLQSQ